MMNRLRVYVIAVMALLLAVTLTSALVWNQGAFTHGLPDYGEGCYCHNNNISAYINGSGDGMFALTFGPFTVGSQFHIKASTSSSHTTGAVPNNQQWMSTQGDNAKFKIFPTGVTDNSEQDLNKTMGNITAIYSVTVPAAAGAYLLTLYAQGVLVSPITILVVAYSGAVRPTATATATASSTASSKAASTPSSTSSTDFISTPAQSTSSSSASLTSTSTGEGGIPEFPYQVLATTIFAFLVVGCYLLVRLHGPQKESAGSLR